MSDPIRPGCEITDCICCNGDVQVCATHTTPWPCEPQREYLKTPEAQVERLRKEVQDLRQGVLNANAIAREAREEWKRLARIVEEALMPFMRDVMQSIGARLELGANVGDKDSLVGMDAGSSRGAWPTFNRSHGGKIEYFGADGRTWVNGKPLPRKPEEIRKHNKKGKRG